MAIIDLFTRKEQVESKKKIGHTFTEIERESAKIKRNSALNFKRKVKAMKEEILLLELQQQKAIKLKEIKEINVPFDNYNEDYDDIEDDLDDEPEDKMDNKLFSLFEKVLSKPQIPQIQPQSNQIQEFNALEIVNQIPMHIRSELKKKTPSEIKDLAKLYYPDLPTEHLEKLIPLL